ncbi:DMT family transporter [Methylomonas methanica]|uniref:EamA domain-containing protein n=1 Tax=Methylomonas methanica (strain DSM 25384 / MC09) TaxID=857087 RepID=G0A1Y4_METMM|nr:DMT family transporter [Methylomonas methanica]AEG01367.1 protein of unknown function DUF6 transmembrane [Methylomonas methanica MC09]
MVKTSNLRIVVFTSVAMLAFAGNSLLCRIALKHTGIDAASFTTVRLVSGALTLWLLVRIRADALSCRGNWLSALALFCYAAGFSMAYVSLPTATGALLLFGAVQTCMIGHDLWRGERFLKRQVAGFLLAFGGLIGLLLPGLSAPPLTGSILMLGAGVAWGIYSLRGKTADDATQVTAGNFLRAVPLSLLLSVGMFKYAVWDSAGAVYAVTSGAVASGLGYAIWYSVLPALKASHAATVQLCVPVLAAVGGIAFLGEPITLRLALASFAILGGIALVILDRTAR